MINWIVSDTEQYLEPFRFDLLNLIVRNRTVWTLNSVYLPKCVYKIYIQNISKNGIWR